MSRIIITKTPMASLAADTSHSRPHRVVTDSDYDVLAGFARSYRRLAELLSSRALRGSAEVRFDDARTLETVPTASVDRIITSPPYLNAIDYMRGHRMSLVWMGYSIPTLRAIRSTSIGSEKGPDSQIGQLAGEILAEALNSGDVEATPNFPVPIVQRYVTDMLTLARTLSRVAKVGCHATFVVGNSRLRGVLVPNDLITRRALEAAGARHINSVTRAIPESNRYLPSNARTGQTALSKRMREEVVVDMELRGYGALED